MQALGHNELPLIPIANLLRMAFYAGDLLDELEDCEATHDDGKSFEGILQAMLVRAGDRIRLRGFERGYAREEEITARPHGRLLIAKSISSGAMPTKRLACEFDEFGADTPHNRVLKAAARHLARVGAEEVQSESLHALVREMREVANVRLSRRLIASLPQSVSTRRYRVVRFIARLIVDAGQPDERIGEHWARRLLRDEKKMRMVFERFVLQWGKAHKPRGVKVYARSLEWSQAPQTRVGALKTDVTVRGAKWTRVIECKYIKSLLTEHHGKRMFHPVHLRQLFAYLARTEARQLGPHHVSGVLLYPAAGQVVSESIDLGGYLARIETLPLAAPWEELTERLHALLFDADLRQPGMD